MPTNLTWTYRTEHGVKRLIAGRFQVFKHSERVRLRRPVFGHTARTDLWYTVTVDGAPLRWPRGGVIRFDRQGEAKQTCQDLTDGKMIEQVFATWT